MSYANLSSIRPPPAPDPHSTQFRNLRGMIEMAETDEGMKELLEKATMYYLLKKPADTVPEDLSELWAPYIPMQKTTTTTAKLTVPAKWWEFK